MAGRAANSEKEERKAMEIKENGKIAQNQAF